MIAFVRVNQAPAYQGANVSTAAFNAMVNTTGNLVVLIVCWLDASNVINVTLTDTAGNTYTAGTRFNANDAGFTSQMFYCANCIGHAANIVTAHFSVATSYISIAIAEYSGVASVSALDVEAVPRATAHSDPRESSAFTTTNANDMIVSMCLRGPGAVTAGTGYTLRSQAIYAAIEDKLVSSIQTGVKSSFNVGNTDEIHVHAMAFKDAAGVYNKILVTTGGVDVMILEPITYAPTKASQLVLYHCGMGQDRESLLTEPLSAAVVAQLLSDGYILAGISDNNRWGNNASLADYATCYNYLKSQYKLNGMVIWAESMGGIAGWLKFGNRLYTDCRGLLGTYPACNLANIYGLGALTASINTAYNIPGGGSYATQTAGHDPVLLPAASFDSKYAKMYASSGDTSVPKANNADQMLALVSAVVQYGAVVACSGNHGDPSHFQPSDYSAFMHKAFSGPATVGGFM